MKIRYSATRLCLIVTLTAVLPAVPMSASDGGADDERLLRLYKAEQSGPIGAIKLNSLGGGAVAIDGRIVQDEAPIWGGELIKTDRTVRVALFSIGQVTLAQGAMVRFATAGYEALVASIVAGSVDVNLNAGAGAYVEAGGSAFTASRGARFSVSVDEGRASISSVAGVVRVQDQPAPPQGVKICIVDALGRPVSSGLQFSVRARSTRQILVQVTDKNDTPLPDLPVFASVSDPCVGSLGLGVLAERTLTQRTDKRGIASVPLVAGSAKCAASITARVEGTDTSVTIQTNVQQPSRFSNTQVTLLVAAAAAVAVGVYFATSGSESAELVTPGPSSSVRP